MTAELLGEAVGWILVAGFVCLIITFAIVLISIILDD